MNSINTTALSALAQAANCSTGELQAAIERAFSLPIPAADRALIDRAIALHAQGKTL